jgi:hypothetical protein
MERAKAKDLAVSAAIAAALAALVTMSFWVRWSILTESPFPEGIDGYFYPIQLRSLLAHGTLAYPASPMAFWLMAPLAALTDPMTGAKLGAALFGALIALPAYGVGARLGNSRGAGLVAAALATTSAGSAFLTVEFVKNSIGLTVGLTALWLVLRALERPTRGRIGVALAGVVAAFLTHKMAAGIVIVIAIPAGLAEAVGRGALRGRRLLYALLLLGAATIAVLVLGLVFPERFLSPDDAGLLHAMWGEARWDLPALGTPNITLGMGHEAVIGAALALIAIGSRLRIVRAQRGELEAAKRSPGERVATWVIAGLALAIALPWLAVTNPQGLGFRMRIVAFVPMALCAASAVTVLEIPFARAFAELARKTATWAAIRTGVLALVALAIVLVMPTDRTEGRVLAHPAMVAAVEGMAGRIPEGGIAIVPERHIAFMVTWYTGVPFRMRPEGVSREQRWRVMPLAFIGIDSPLDQLLMAARREPGLVPPVGTHPRHPNGLVLVAEPTWEWILARLPPAARDHFARWPTI